MLNSVITIQAGETVPLFVSTNKSVETEKLALHKWVDDDWVKVDAEFETAGHLLYKVPFSAENIGYIQVKVMYEETTVSSTLLHVTHTVRDLIDAQMGNWEIKEKQMIFYRVDGSELMRFNLYDKDGKNTTFGVVRRERV